jgi:hypothetical protein
MPPDRGLVRNIAWQEVFPWLLLLRTVKMALEARKLCLAAAAIILTASGWWALGWAFSGREADPHLSAGITDLVSLPWEWGPAAPRILPEPDDIDPRAPTADWSVENPWFSPWQRLSEPFRRLFDARMTLTGLAFYATCALWALAIWAWFGGAIARMAAVELAREDRPPTKAVFAHVRRKWPAYVAAPLLPLMGVLIGIVLLAPIGLLARWDATVVGAGLLWPLALVGGLVLTIFLVGLVFGWPLMWGAISTEAMDSWDALSRSYAYVYQRPLHYLFYAAVSAVLGALGWLFIWAFVSLVVYLAAWSASWTAGGARIEQLDNAAPEAVAALRWPGMADPAAEADPPGTLRKIGAAMIGFWSALARLLALGFAYSFFWTASTAIYLLLRRDTDGTPLDEVHLDDEEDATPLPPLRPDAAGVPLVTDDAPPATGSSAPLATGSSEPAGPSAPPAGSSASSAASQGNGAEDGNVRDASRSAIDGGESGAAT